jgi:hypothetical protein
VIDVCFDDDSFDTAEEAALFEQDVIRQLPPLDTESLCCAVKRLFDIPTFETLAHRSPPL